jgi:hypothetical protein
LGRIERFELAFISPESVVSEFLEYERGVYEDEGLRERARGR